MLAYARREKACKGTTFFWIGQIFPPKSYTFPLFFGLKIKIAKPTLQNHPYFSPLTHFFINHLQTFSTAEDELMINRDLSIQTAPLFALRQISWSPRAQQGGLISLRSNDRLCRTIRAFGDPANLQFVGRAEGAVALMTESFFATCTPNAMRKLSVLSL